MISDKRGLYPGSVGLHGPIEPGKRADFTVLAADTREIPPEEVPEIPVVMTAVDGKIVWWA